MLLAKKQTNAPSISILATRFGHALKSVANSFIEMLVSIAEASPRLRQIELLQAMSDEELASLGLRRDQIARYVFRNRLI